MLGQYQQAQVVLRTEIQPMAPYISMRNLRRYTLKHLQVQAVCWIRTVYQFRQVIVVARPTLAKVIPQLGHLHLVRFPEANPQAVQS